MISWSLGGLWGVGSGDGSCRTLSGHLLRWLRSIAEPQTNRGQIGRATEDVGPLGAPMDVKRPGRLLGHRVGSDGDRVELSSDVAFEATDDFASGLAFGATSLDVAAAARTITVRPCRLLRAVGRAPRTPPWAGRPEAAPRPGRRDSSARARCCHSAVSSARWATRRSWSGRRASRTRARALSSPAMRLALSSPQDRH